MIYDANADSFTVSRKDYTSLVGSYAASSFNQYVVGNHLLDASGVSLLDLPTSERQCVGIRVRRSGRLLYDRAEFRRAWRNSTDQLEHRRRHSTDRDGGSADPLAYH